MLTRLLILTAIFLFAAAGSLASAQDSAPSAVGPTLTAVQARGQLICGIDEQVFGFGFLNPNTGEITGLQVDFCRALAAAVIGEAAAVDLRLHQIDTPPAETLADGLDVLFQHTYSASLDAAFELATGRAPIFYDGASVLVSLGGVALDWPDLDGATVCLLADSASAAAFAIEMNRRQLAFEAAELASVADMRAAFLEGRCTAQALDRSLLEISRASTDNPDGYTVWPQPFTYRPILPLYQYGDAHWGQIIDWTIWGLIEAERLGISSVTLESLLRRAAESDSDYVRRVGRPTARLIDAQLGLGGKLGLPADFMAQVIRQVGNYGEIYDRNLGPGSTLTIERSLNHLWVNGGLLEAPVWR
jgi:general L-amino acid transport system substrate-binding protein